MDARASAPRRTSTATSRRSRSPGALGAAISYYRAALRHPAEALESSRRIERPTLILWGESDPYVPPGLAEPDAELVPDARVEILPGAGHWVQNERPERVNELLLDFLGPPGGTA